MLFLTALVLMMSSISALYERRRSLALLRLVGMPRGILPGVIAREILIPLTAMTGLAAMSGYFTAWLLITSLSADRTVGWPDPLMLVALVATAFMVGVAIWVTSMAGERVLRTEQVRYE